MTMSKLCVISKGPKKLVFNDYMDNTMIVQHHDRSD